MGPSETVAPGAITWEMAMESAARLLSAVPEKPKMGDPAWRAASIAHAQGWIAFARELTMHARAQQ